MRIAITGANGLVGKHVTKYCIDRGHYVVKIDLPHTKGEEQPNSEFHAINVATEYASLKKAFEGCDAVIHLAAIPSPGSPDQDPALYATNSNASFNALHAAGTLGIKKVCQASSVNALGLVYSQRPLVFDHFPIEENDTPRVCDAYALSKQVCEVQGESFAYWFPGMTIASLRFHHVNPRDVCRKRLDADPEVGIRELWCWVSPEATARACFLSIDGDRFTGHEAFNIVAPAIIDENASSVELARKYYPDTKLKNFHGNQGFWSIEKAKRILGWDHPETT